MPVVKQIICLANSRKLNGRCIAGIELSEAGPLGWIRPVSARDHEEVSEYERQYDDGSDPRVLDVMLVPLIEPRPKGYQQENWLLDPIPYWKRTSRVSWGHLEALEDPATPLWLDGTAPGKQHNDRVALAQAMELRSSLRLVRVERMTLAVFKPGEAFGNPKRRVQARFTYLAVDYRLWVTDPNYERAYLLKPDGVYQIGESFLTISLGEPYEGFCYKLVAAIIEREAS